MALVGAIAPLGKVAGQKKDWLAEVTIYTLAGCLTSAFVGALFGLLGKLLSTAKYESFGLWLAIAIGLIAIVRELGWVSLPFPQLKRQTKDIWGKLFPRKVAAMLWGLDLGLIFTTRLTFSGIYLVTIVTILHAEPLFGAGLFVLYWLGRAFSLWLVSILMPNASSTDWVLDRIYTQYRLFQHIHVSSLVLVVVVLIVWLARGGTM